MPLTAKYKPLLKSEIDPQEWAKLGRFNVQQATQQLHDAMKGRVWSVFIGAGFFPVVLGILSIFVPEVRLLACASAVVLVLALYANHDLSRKMRVALENLRPLTDFPGLCEEALTLAGNPGAAAYRDKVVASGREFIKADILCMRKESSRHQVENLCQQIRKRMATDGGGDVEALVDALITAGRLKFKLDYGVSKAAFAGPLIELTVTLDGKAVYRDTISSERVPKRVM